MHPLTVYDIAIRDHEHATAQRQRQHLLTRRLRERARPVPTRDRATRRGPLQRPAVD